MQNFTAFVINYRQRYGISFFDTCSAILQFLISVTQFNFLTYVVRVTAKLRNCVHI